MKRLLSIAQGLGMFMLLVVTWSVLVFHMGVMTQPNVSEDPQASGRWIDKSRFGMHQLVVSGSAYGRGVLAGQLTKELLYKQEKHLTSTLEMFIPSLLLRTVLEIAAIRWFWGIEDYLDPWMKEEMLGVSKSASHDFDYYADTYTRQIAYHGIHEVGQLTVDQGIDMGCTVVVLPFQDSFVVGRNFDFEAGRIFDTEKILKWVFPAEGFAFVSVIWAGMVGGVTGVNEHGVYISINAAGSQDFRRHGTPSTLVLTKALQSAKTSDEAVRIIREATMFITDIFVVADTKSVYRVEKSPKRTEVFVVKDPTIITNHLVSKAFKDDSVNAMRRDELTSTQRLMRGEELLTTSLPFKTADADEAEVLALQILRDKGEFDGKPLTLGNRQAIDALIATHSVIYNAHDAVLFVSQGPGVSGPFTGFDLKTSFSLRAPTALRTLAPDPLVSEEVFNKVRTSEFEVNKALISLKHKDCDAAYKHLQIAQQNYEESSDYHAALGDYLECKGRQSEAQNAWKQALSLAPAYSKQRKALKEKIR